MGRVLLTGWMPGLRKVALTKLIQSRTNVSLKAAMAYTERVLAGDTVVIELPTVADARAFALEAQNLGVVVESDVSQEAARST
jgi:hypothetical protein